VATKPFDSDSLKSYEGGFKAETADRKLGLDLSVYDIEWSKIQLKFTNASGFSSIVNAPGGARVQGGELTLSAHPNRDVTVTGAFGYTHSYLKEAVPIVGAAQGERLPNTPRFTAALNGDYQLPISSNLSPTVGATLRYVSERTASFDHNLGFAQYRLPSYTLVDLRSGFVVSSVNVQLYVHNLANRRAELGDINNFLGAPRIAIQQPRTVGVQIGYRFR
jgi:outer membrane receptor protein involved in Fe transport